MSEGEDGNGRMAWLAQQLEEKEAIINGISDALMLLDARTYKILDVNKAFLESYGLSRDEVVGKKCYEITHHLDRPCHKHKKNLPCPVQDSVATGNSSHAEHIHKDRNGQDLYVEITSYPLKDDSGQVTKLIHLSRDTTLRKHLELELREREKLSGMLELAGGASHEINQPLTVIISGLEQLIKRLRHGETEKDLALMILSNAKRLAEVSKKLARITRVASKDYVAGKRIIDLDESGRQEPEP